VARKVYWGLLPLLTVMGVFIYLDRSNLSFISGQIIPALGLTNADYGLGSGACREAPLQLRRPALVAAAAQASRPASGFQVSLPRQHSSMSSPSGSG
jgi:hypothetical protein